MGVLLPWMTLLDVSYSLVEDVVNTQVNPNGADLIPGTQAVAPGSMLAIYPGAQLVVGGTTPEVITVISIGPTTFTATFANAHTKTDPLYGATFPSGQNETIPLWTQAEMLSYLAGAQNSFLLNVRPIYTTAQQAMTVGKFIYPAPADAIRMERISIIDTSPTPPTAYELWNDTQNSLDWQAPDWQEDTTQPTPTFWVQDKVGNQNFGVAPPPQVGCTATIYYAQRGGNLSWLTPYLIPDCLVFALKWRVLALALSKDGEMRDTQRAQFAQRWFEMVCDMTRKFIWGVDGRIVKDNEQVEPYVDSLKKGA